MKTNLLILMIVSFCQFLFAQDLQVDAYVDRNKIGLSDQLKFTIEISGAQADQVKTPELPEIKGFRNLGSSSSMSSSYSLINGKMTSEITQKYTFTLSPTQKGSFLIPPVTIKFRKQTFTTNPIDVTVLEGSTQPAPPASRGLDRSGTQSSDKLEDNLFLRLDVTNRSPYQNEPIQVEYKLYTRYDIANLSFGNDPVFNGFWKEDVFTPAQISLTRQNLQGVIYNTMLMRSITLFPTQTGTLEIPALELIVDIRTPARSFFDFGSTKRYTIKSKPQKIKVHELPEKDKPDIFKNAVGNFSISSQISETQLKVGDSFTFTVILNGKGNLKQFDIPQLPDIQHLRFLDPEITNEINKDKISGRKMIKYLVIAQEKGTFEIPAVVFSYFDPQQHKYITKRTMPYQIVVEEGDRFQIPSSSAQFAVTQEGRDIGFIISTTNLRSFSIYFDSLLYWLIFGGILLFLPLAMLYAGEQQKVAANLDYQRQKKAAKILKKYMKQATDLAMKADSGFYSAAQTGLSSYLADRLRIPRGSTTEAIISQIEIQKIPDEQIHKIKEFFQKSMQARFMPGGFSQENIESDYKLLKQIVSDISRLKF